MAKLLRRPKRKPLRDIYVLSRERLESIVEEAVLAVDPRYGAIVWSRHDEDRQIFGAANVPEEYISIRCGGGAHVLFRSGRVIWAWASRDRWNDGQAIELTRALRESIAVRTHYTLRKNTAKK